MIGAQSIYKIYNKFNGFEQKVFVVLLIVGVVGTLGILGATFRNVTENVPIKGGRLVEGVLGQPTNLNPIMPPQTDADHDLRSLVHAGLLGVNSQGELEPLLAERMPEVSDDLKTYTLTIKDNVKWQDGFPIVADDVIHTVKNIQDRQEGSYLRFSFKFTKVEKVDERTVRFALREPSATFPENLLVGLLPQHLQSEYDDLNPVGAGPYKISRYKYSGSGEYASVELIPNEHYLSRPYIEKLHLRFYNSPEDIVQAFKSGRIDSFGALPSAESIGMLRRGKIYTASIPQHQAVFFNTEKNNIFSNLKVREALKIGANRQQIVENVYQNTAQPVGGPVNELVEASVPEFSKDRAAALLEEDGWKAGGDGLRSKDGQSLAFTLRTNNSAINSQVASLLASQWREIGFNVSVETASNREMLESVIRPRDYEAILVFENVGHDPDPFPFWHSSQVADPGLNLSMVKNTEIDKLIIDARTTIDLAKRKELYGKFMEIIDRDSPAVFLVRPNYLYWTSRKVKNVDINKIALPGERFSGIENWYIRTKPVLK